MKNKGLFIVIEGIDGTGKSSQVQRLAEWFREQGREVIVSREPTDGFWGAKLRASAMTGRLTGDQEIEYFINDRREHVEHVISPALREGNVVILDRYYFSMMAYQGARGYDPKMIREQNEVFAPVPDILLILDLEVRLAHQRIGKRGDEVNEFEKMESLERCREIFMTVAHEPFVHVIDASGDFDQVADRMRETVVNFIKDQR